MGKSSITQAWFSTWTRPRKTKNIVSETPSKNYLFSNLRTLLIQLAIWFIPLFWDNFVASMTWDDWKIRVFNRGTGAAAYQIYTTMVSPSSEEYDYYYGRKQKITKTTKGVDPSRVILVIILSALECTMEFGIYYGWIVIATTKMT